MREKRQYYSIRTGKNPLSSRLDLPTTKRMFADLYAHFLRTDYFQEALGYTCIDEGYVCGTCGCDIAAYFIRKTRKVHLWPIKDNWQQYSEDDMFDVIELLFDLVSKPAEGRFHSYGDCGWHYSTFDKAKGRQEYRNEMNEILKSYQDGYELSSDGEILALAQNGLNSLIEANIPFYDPENIEKRIKSAIHKFRRQRSSLEERRDAVRDLADVLEYLRPQLKDSLNTKDESDLFNLANSFGIRHHNEKQKTDYDKPIWYSWMFYYYLATIHASLRLIEKHRQDETGTSTSDR